MIRCAVAEDRRAVVLSDRPIPDSRGYLQEGKEGERIYAELLREVTGLTRIEALDRYAAIVKLTTAALGAEAFYTLENNRARDEDPEAARYLDKRVEEAYLAVDNPNEEIRVRRRILGDSSTFYLTKKRVVGPGTRIETEEAISWQTYLNLLETRDQKRGIIEKDRYCFLWQNQYFELDVFKNLREALCLLEIELTNLQKSVILPPFLDVHESDEVTDDPRYKNQTLAFSVRNYP